MFFDVSLPVFTPSFNNVFFVFVLYSFLIISNDVFETSEKFKMSRPFASRRIKVGVCSDSLGHF